MAGVKKMVEEFKSLREKLIPNETFDEYKYEHVSTKNELRVRQVLLGEAIKLLINLEMYGGTEEEIARLTKYFWILMESEKAGLNFNKARNDLGIAELTTKYKYFPDKTVSVRA